MIDSPTATLNRTLAAHGFVYVGRDHDNWLTYTGALVADNDSYPILIAVHPQGHELPIIILQKVPERLLPIAPHVSNSGSICYAAAGSIVLDVYDIAGQTLACIERAEAVLGAILRGEMIDDLEEEFFSYWTGDACFLDLRQSSNNNCECIIAKYGEHGNITGFITNDRERTLEKIKSLNGEIDTRISVPVGRIRTQVNPRPMIGNWPPRTVSEVLHWQGLLDSACRRKLDEHLVEIFKSGNSWMLCLVESPNMPYAFWVDFSDYSNVLGVQRITNSRQMIYKAKVQPVHCFRIDNEYIARRNNPEEATLARRKIALVGCGTIGGFLTELMVKAGAGSDGGELTLIDHDILAPQNIGRHRLGFNSILKNKAVALADEMRQSMPGANLRALPIDVMQANLGQFDIVVNATGEEALGHLLVGKLRKPRFVPILSVWIEGPGVATRALLTDSPAAACTRCLNSVNRQPLYEIVDGKMPFRLAGHGCESLYVPFPASASLQAACLAIDMLIAWVGGNPTPRLRTRILADHLRKGAPDQDPLPLTKCPACST